MTPDGRRDFWDEPNLAMDKVIESLAYRARLGAKMPIWQTVDMPMSKPGWKDVDLLEAPIEFERTERDGTVVRLPIEPGWGRDDMIEDDLVAFLASHPPESRYPMLETARGQKDGTPRNIIRYVTLASIMAQPHEATAAAMAAHQARREGAE